MKFCHILNVSTKFFTHLVLLSLIVSLALWLYYPMNQLLHTGYKIGEHNKNRGTFHVCMGHDTGSWMTVKG